MKKTLKVIGIILCLIIIISIVFLLINKSYSKVSLKVNILENEVYYSDSFEVSKNTIQVYSNMDCAIEIVNVDDDSDSVSIGYLTPGMSESIKLNKNKKYRIKSDLNSDKLVITIKGAKK
jgi:ADP-ribosylglycohydrolase